MKKYLLVSLLVLFGFYQLAAQVMPSPDASSLIKNVNIPVNAYNGVASISVPLLEAKSLNGASVPVSLQYNTGGIKLAEVAGVAGLGWHLNAGGMITRVVRDASDHHQFIKGNLDHTKYHEIYDKAVWNDKAIDFEKDIFYYSYPGGSGRFILKQEYTYDNFLADYIVSSLEPIQLPESDIKIEVSGGNTLLFFIITDTQGNRYHYGSTANSEERTSLYEKKNTENYSLEDAFTSTWHLDKIEYAGLSSNGDITFSYRERAVEDENISYRHKLSVGPPPPYGGSYHSIVETDKFYQKTNIFTKYLDEIIFPKGKIKFEYQERDDLDNGLRLSEVVLSNHLDVDVTKYTFYQAYFIGEPNDRNVDETFYKRLRLNEIKRNGYSFRKFDYLNDKFFNISGGDLYELPPRNSFYYDHWGYFTGIGAYYKSHVSYSGLYGANRSHSGRSKANILIKLEYPSGGYDSLSYSHHAKNPGVRIDKIERFESTGKLLGGTEYVYDPLDEVERVYPVYQTFEPNGSEGGTSKHTYSHARNLILELNGSTTGYSKVKTVDISSGSYSISHFITPTTNSSPPPIKYMYNIDMENNSGGVNTSYQPQTYHPTNPFTTNSLKFYDHGLVDNIEGYDENGIIVSSTDYVYEHSPVVNSFTNRAMALYSYDIDRNDEDYRVIISEYEIESKFMNLDKTISRSYDDDGQLVSESTTDIGYHSVYKTLPSSVHTSRTDNSGAERFSSIQQTFYPSDKSGIEKIYSETVLDEMVDNNMIGIPVQTINKVMNPGDYFKVSNVNVSTFRNQDGLIKPYQLWKTDFTKPRDPWLWNILSPLRVRSTFVYNNKGLLESQIGADEIETRNLYDDQGYLLSTTIDPGPVSLERTTSYTYKPLVGIETVTGPDGRKITNEYDDQNRLHLVRDNDDNIIKRYRYNLASEPVFLTGDIHVYGTTQTGNTLTFKAAEVSGYGGDDATQYKWDINGTSYDGKVLTDVPFAISGRYDIILSMINPEYDVPFVTSRTVYIFDDEYNPDVTGPTTYNSCNNTPTSSVSFSLGLLNLQNAGYVCLDGGSNETDTSWEYQLNGGSWQEFNGTLDSNKISVASNYFIRYKLIDACGVPRYSETHSFTVTADCGDGPGDPNIH